MAVGKAVDARFIALAEYNPPDLHPSHPFEDRLAVVNRYAKSWKVEDRKGPLRQMQQGIETEVDYTLAYVVREGERVGIPVPLCRAVLRMIHDIEQGKRHLQLQNYDELARVIA